MGFDELYEKTKKVNEQGAAGPGYGPSMGHSKPMRKGQEERIKQIVVSDYSEKVARVAQRLDISEDEVLKILLSIYKQEAVEGAKWQGIYDWIERSISLGNLVTYAPPDVYKKYKEERERKNKRRYKEDSEIARWRAKKEEEYEEEDKRREGVNEQEEEISGYEYQWQIDGEYGTGTKGFLSIGVPTEGGGPGIGADAEFDGTVDELFNNYILTDKGKELAGGEKVGEIEVNLEGVSDEDAKRFKELLDKNRIAEV